MADEKRLIDANARIEEIKKAHCTNCENYGGVRCRACWGDDAIGLIDDAPTVDAVEVVHGRWIQQGELDEDGNGQYHCSVCSAGEKHNPIVDVPYCWKCGAKMDGDRNA